MSGYVPLRDLGKYVVGLNIEGDRPAQRLPKGCDWYNIVLAIDEPLLNITFQDVMYKVQQNQFCYIEQAIPEFDVDKYIVQMQTVINRIKENNDYKNMLVHVHQYTGTTKLAETIQERTKIKTILDTTNFFETPVDYAATYPDIDCLISISQCASMSLECKAGTLLVADRFMGFDVKHNIIYTAKKPPAENKIEKYLTDIPHVVGTVLVVNDLYNPTKKEVEQEGVLLLDEDDQKVLDFVKQHTLIFDESHDFRHALKVAYNATKILNTKKVLYLALLHDVCDHKYANALKRELLTQYILCYLSEYKDIDTMIDKVSFSKQGTDFSPCDPVLEAVRDGDRLEALGEIGIKRCEAIVQMKGGKIPQDVIIHCFDKLLRLLPHGYICTKIGRQLAVEKHNVIVKYVNTLLPTYPELGYPLQNYICKL